MRTKRKVPYFTTTVDAEVEIDPDDLREAGWHHENECSGGEEGTANDFEWPVLDNEDVRSLAAALASLHRQAHPREARSVRLCHEEPCRSLNLDQLAQVDG